MKPIVLPKNYNYCGVFLTLRCNLNCDYCINRQGDFEIPYELSGEEWIAGLSRIKTRQDLPITLQGGEPTMHKDFYGIVSGLRSKKLDLLTNGIFDVREFIKRIPSTTFKRKAKYASIRISYHPKVNPYELVNRILPLHIEHYEIGIWGLDNHNNKAMREMCKMLNIDFREKEYLDKTHGTYKYPKALNGKLKSVLCKPSELLINPSGYIFRCHADLYANRNQIAHILDKEIKFPNYLRCDNFGACNPCDIKLKFDRFQRKGHCSVTIKDL